MSDEELTTEMVREAARLLDAAVPICGAWLTEEKQCDGKLGPGVFFGDDDVARHCSICKVCGDVQPWHSNYLNEAIIEAYDSPEAT